MRAINTYVIISKIKEEPKKVAGLEMTESQNKDLRYLKGKVVSVGDQIPEHVLKENDTVRYDKHAGHQIEHDNELYFVIKVGDIVAVE